MEVVDIYTSVERQNAVAVETGDPFEHVDLRCRPPERTLHADHAVPVRPQFKPCICHSVAKAGRSAGADNSHVAREEQRREGAVHQLLAATLDACLLARNATQTTKQESATPANNQSGVAFNVSIAFCDAAVLTVTSIPSLLGSSHMM